MPRRLTRNTEDALVGGVASGTADYFDIDPVIVRLGFVLLCLMGGGGLILYIICWVVIPAGAGRPAAPGDTLVGEMRQAGETAVGRIREPGSAHRGQMIAGAILVFLGSLLLLDRLTWFGWLHGFNWSGLWPLILIAFGIGILLKRGSDGSQEAPPREAR